MQFDKWTVEGAVKSQVKPVRVFCDVASALRVRGVLALCLSALETAKQGGTAGL